MDNTFKHSKVIRSYYCILLKVENLSSLIAKRTQNGFQHTDSQNSVKNNSIMHLLYRYRFFKMYHHCQVMPVYLRNLASVFICVFSQILKPSEKKAKYQYGGMNSGRPITPPRGPVKKK